MKDSQDKQEVVAIRAWDYVVAFDLMTASVYICRFCNQLPRSLAQCLSVPSGVYAIRSYIIRCGTIGAFVVAACVNDEC